MERLEARPLPRSGPAREALREKGQFWTPDWVARAMVAYALAGGCDVLLDPAVGAGAFFRAARAIEPELGRRVRLLGCEIDVAALREATGNGLTPSDLRGVELRDFVLDPPPGPFAAIVANPPYLRHHRLPAETKQALRAFAEGWLGSALDGRAGLHVYFLLRALTLLRPDGGRLAFIVPADTCEGVFAPQLWEWIARRFRLDAVVTFAPEATPFPGVDTNAVVLMVRAAAPRSHFHWAHVLRVEEGALERWVRSGFRDRGAGIVAEERALAEGLRTGLTRPPASGVGEEGPVLGDYARAMRGIATGANDFFLLTRERAHALGIPTEMLLPAIARTRDVPGDRVDEALLAALAAAGRPTLLFCPDGRTLAEFPESVRRYLEEGERRGLPARPLLASRRPWYRMERRPPPPWLFAYLGRRNARFVRNLAGAVPLTGFLCVYPHRTDPQDLASLGEVLRHPEVVANLRLVGKSYGAGCIKVEPRALERLPLPERVVVAAGLPLPARHVSR